MNPSESSESSESPHTGGDVGASPAAAKHGAGGLVQRVTGKTMKARGAVDQKVKGVIDQRYKGSSAEVVWARLSSMGFINRGVLFAGTLLLCFFPFIIVVNALAGRGTVAGLTRHLGLNHQAAADLSHVFEPASATSNSVSGAGYVVFVLGGIAAATAVQDLYERAFGLESRGMKDLLRRCVWLCVLVGFLVLGGWVSPAVRHSGGPALAILFSFVAFTLFWWFTMWFLLAGRVHWRHLIPAAVATGIFWVGMEIVFSLTFSSELISDFKKYGPIGVVFALMSFFIAIGVVIILGAVVGIVWQERELSFGRAFRYLARRGSEHSRRMLSMPAMQRRSPWSRKQAGR